MTTGTSHSSPAGVPAIGEQIVYDRATRDYALYLDGDLVGYACTVRAARTTLEALLSERQCYSAPAPDPLPLPPLPLIAAALEDLAATASEPEIYHEARVRLLAGLSVAAAGTDRLIAGVRVQGRPDGQRWPWRCECGRARCWHGALLAAIVVAWEHLADEEGALPFVAVRSFVGGRAAGG